MRACSAIRLLTRREGRQNGTRQPAASPGSGHALVGIHPLRPGRRGIWHEDLGLGGHPEPPAGLCCLAAARKGAPG